MLSFQDILIPDKIVYAFVCFDTCKVILTFFYVLCPKLALSGKKIGTNMFENWHQYIYNLRQYIYSKIGSNIFAIDAFFHLCHTNLQVMTPGAEDRVQTLSLGLEAPLFGGLL